MCGVGVASHMLLTAEPIDAQQALQCNGHEGRPARELMAEAETIARQILRNSQRAVRSAKETIAEVIGQDLDAQLRIEAWNGYTRADREETLGLLAAVLRQGGRGASRHQADRALSVRSGS